MRDIVDGDIRKENLGKQITTMYLYTKSLNTGDSEMTNVKISERGKAFLRNTTVAVKVASALVNERESLQSRDGVVVKLNDKSTVTVRSAGAYASEILER